MARAPAGDAASTTDPPAWTGFSLSPAVAIRPSDASRSTPAVASAVATTLTAAFAASFAAANTTPTDTTTTLAATLIATFTTSFAAANAPTPATFAATISSVNAASPICSILCDGGIRRKQLLHRIRWLAVLQPVGQLRHKRGSLARGRGSRALPCGKRRDNV